MPCYEPRRDNHAEVRAECAREFRHNSDVAQMLCEVMRHLQRVTGRHMPSMLAELSPELQQWWYEHKQRDTSR